MRVEGGSGFRLLTEAEWEYAARGGGPGRFGVTDDPADLGRFAWFAENSENQTHEVGLKEPNGFGLHDMLGNVWEWCWDWYARDGYRQRADGEDDQGGPSSGSERSVEGRMLEFRSAVAAVCSPDRVHADRAAALLLRVPPGPDDHDHRLLRRNRTGRRQQAAVRKINSVVRSRRAMECWTGSRWEASGSWSITRAGCSATARP